MIAKPDTDKIKKLRNDIREAKNLVVSLEKNLFDELCDHYNIHVGEAVTAMPGCGMSSVAHKKILVTDISFAFNPPWVRGKPQKKNGNFAASTRSIMGHWTKDELHDG